jgi:hypothetical protein
MRGLLWIMWKARASDTPMAQTLGNEKIAAYAYRKLAMTVV